MTEEQWGTGASAPAAHKVSLGCRASLEQLRKCCSRMLAASSGLDDEQRLACAGGRAGRWDSSEGSSEGTC